ncbi:hypothetical protein R9C00_10320 [Flammeovirgaceae bacterium SG7u.111]|nr:hypothetical protein [Flammeovirgaceae bacterium SG7u.132]WPO37847.1 hypothetical protein R9C00_10320 [Flammeovirgaceae bacterium SG7u.111]
MQKQVDAKKINNDFNKEDVIKKKKLKKKNSIIRNGLFLIIWTYIALRVFIGDLEMFYILNYSRESFIQHAILRNLFFTTIVFVYWNIVGNKKFWKNIGLFFLFPFYPFLLNSLVFLYYATIYYPIEILFRLGFNSFIYSYLDLIIGSIINFKNKVISAVMFTASVYFIYIGNEYMLIIAIVFLFLLLFGHLNNRFKEVFTPFNILRLPIDLMPSSEDELDDIVNNTFEEKANRKDKKRHTDGLKFKLEDHILMHEFINIVNAKIKSILQQRTYAKSFLWKALFSFFYSILIVAIINFALYKFSTDNFKLETNPTFFNFFYYSVYSVFPNGTDIIAQSIYAKSLQIIGVFVGVVIQIIILAISFTISTEKYKESYSLISAYSEKYSNKHKEKILKKYGLDSISSAILSLETEGKDVKNQLRIFKKLFGIK